MNEKELAALLEKVQGTINNSEVIAGLKADLANLKDGAITPESFKESLDKFAEEHGVAGLKENLDKVALELKKLQEAGPKVVKSLRDRLVENVETMKAIGGGSKNHTLTLDNVKTTVARSAVSGHTLAHRLTDVGQLPYAAIVMNTLFRQATIGPNNNGTIRYVDQASVTRNAAGVAEAGTYPESVITWIERNLPVEKIGDSIPVTREAVNDVDFIESEINRLLTVDVALIEDNYLWDGTGTPPQLKGVYTSAGTFSAAGLPKKVDASIYDLIRTVKTDLSNGKESKYMPNFVVMNPLDVDVMQSKKDGNFNYVMPPWVSNDGMSVAGMRIVESPAVTQNTMLVGDFNYGTYYASDAFQIELGWVNAQFTADLMTLKASKLGALLVRTVDETAFQKVTDITAALAAITA